MKKKYKNRVLGWFISFLISSIVFLAVNIFAFPTSSGLLEEKAQAAVSSPISIADPVQTTNASSVFYQISTEEAAYLIHAEKAPFLPRYRIEKPIPFAEGEIYKTEDFSYKITVQEAGGTLLLETERHLPLSILAFAACLLATCANLIQAIMQTKKK